MARWYALDSDGEAYGSVLEAPDKQQAIDLLTARDGMKCYGAISVLDFEAETAERAARARRKGKPVEDEQEE